MEPGLEPTRTWDCDGEWCYESTNAYETTGMPTGWYWLAVGQATREGGRELLSEYFCSLRCLNRRIRSTRIRLPDEEG
jgi:hypothetical protein